jgi:hypothetical protein
MTINNLPKFLVADPNDQRHALTLTNPNNPLQPVILPLILRGMTLLLNVRSTTINEFDRHDYLRLHLTSETLTWDPTTDLYEKQENAMMNYSGNIVRDAAVKGPKLILNELQSLITDLAYQTHDCNFHQVLTAPVVMSSINASLSGHVRLCKTVPIDCMTLAGRWMIAPDRAKKTVQWTMQQGVRTCLNPTLARRFPTNDQMLHYKRLLHTTLLTLLLLACLPVVEISVLKYTPRPLPGQEHTP